MLAKDAANMFKRAETRMVHRIKAISGHWTKEGVVSLVVAIHNATDLGRGIERRDNDERLAQVNGEMPRDRPLLPVIGSTRCGDFCTGSTRCVGCGRCDGVV